MLIWTTVRARVPSVGIGPLLGLPFLRVWFWSLCFHLVCFVTPHQVQAGTASRGQSLLPTPVPVPRLCKQAAFLCKGRQKWNTGACHAQEVFFYSEQFPIICPQGTCPSHHAADQRLLICSKVTTVLPLPKSVLIHAEPAVSAGIMVDEETGKTEGVSRFINVAGCCLLYIR